MPRRKLTYQEGDWFAVPLPQGGYSLGRVARHNGRGCVLGYFFGPFRPELPTAADTHGLTAEHARDILLFGDLDLLEGAWPIITRPKHWDREAWPLPDFGRISLDGERAWLVQYDERTLLDSSEGEVSPDEARGLPDDRLYGSGAVATHLEQLLPRPEDA